jgi:acyl-CoA thioester hydrolase
MPRAFTWPIRVYWEDTDAGGVVYYANYLKFLERARSEWLRALGFEQPELISSHGGVFVVKRIEADYLRPARFNESLIVEAEVETLRKASLVMRQRILHEAENLLFARVTLAWVNEKTFKPARIPLALLQSIAT